MGGNVIEGNANFEDRKVIQNDDCKTRLEVNFWRENTISICEHSITQQNIYTNNQIVSAQDNLLKLPTSPNYQGRTKTVDFGGKLYPEELTTEDLS